MSARVAWLWTTPLKGTRVPEVGELRIGAAAARDDRRVAVSDSAHAEIPSRRWS